MVSYVVVYRYACCFVCFCCVFVLFVGGREWACCCFLCIFFSGGWVLFKFVVVLEALKGG